MVLGLVSPDAGQVRLFGEPLQADRAGMHGRDLAAAAVLDLLYLAGAVWFFRRMLVTARRTGGMARFAE